MFKYGDKVQVKETGQVGVVDAIFGKPPAYTLKGFSPAKPYYEEHELEFAGGEEVEQLRRKVEEFKERLA